MSGATSGISAGSISGAITIGGAGAVTGATGIVASSGSGAITIAGTGATTASAGRGIDAQITDAGSNETITITRSGDVTSQSGAFAGIYAENKGTGGVTIAGIGTVSSAAGNGVHAIANSSALQIGTTGAALRRR